MKVLESMRFQSLLRIYYVHAACLQFMPKPHQEEHQEVHQEVHQDHTNSSAKTRLKLG